MTGKNRGAQHGSTNHSNSKSFVWDDVDIQVHGQSRDSGAGIGGSAGAGWNRKLMMAAMSGAIAGSGPGLGVGSGGGGGGGKPPNAASLRAAAMEERKAKRRPDRRPFILDVPGSIFFPSRSMPKACSKYPAVIGETFWRLLAYLDSIPSHLPERIPEKSPHLLVNGVEGSGKSYLLASAAAVLGLSSYQYHQSRYYSMNGDQHRTVLISDCKRWLESEDPLQHFRMELLSAFRNDSLTLGGDHSSPDHLGCLQCVEPFSKLDDAQAFIQKCIDWFFTFRPDTWFIFFIDQAEELVGRETSIPYLIVKMLVEAKLPILVFGQRTPPKSPFPFAVGATITVPFRMAQAEFTKQMEQLSAPEDRLWGREISLWKDVRLWTGGNPGDTQRLAIMPGSSFLHRIQLFREVTRSKTLSLIGSKKLEARQRNILLISIFAMILRVPLDWSEKFNIKELRDLDPEISGLLQTDCLQSFFHPSDGTIAIRAIPTAISMASHLALMSHDVLNCIAPTYISLFETVVSAMHNSKQLCSEARRRFARFYMYAKLIWRLPPSSPTGGWKLQGKSHMGEDLTIKFKDPRIIMFAGQVPSQYHFLGSEGLNSTGPTIQPSMAALLKPDLPIDPFHDASIGAYQSIVFIPGRTAYHFFDIFIFSPDDKKLYAICTTPVVAAWLKELETKVAPAQLQQHRDDGLLTPLILLENWKEALRKAGFPKLSVKCCLMKPTDLLSAFGSTFETALPAALPAAPKKGGDRSSSVEALASQFVTATSISPDKDTVIDNN